MIRLVSTIMEMYTMRRSIKMEGFTMLFVFFPLLFIQGASTTLDAITPGQSVRDGDTVVSSDELFELGFFSPGNPKNRYLGIQYKQVSDRSVTWVANRENPINDRHGVLNFTKEGRLVLFDGRSKVVWSPRIMTAARNPVVLLLEQGNLVVRDGDADNILWQSFDYPSNTLLAEMKLGKNFETGQERSLSSWKNPEDPAKGQFTLSIDPLGFPQLVLKKGSVIQYRLGSWNGLYFTGTPDLKQVNVFKYVFVLNQREVYYTWDRENSLISKLVMNVSGFLQRFARLKTTDHWTLVYDAPRDQCDYYSFCGAYASCNINKKPAVCACLEGFGPKYPKDWNVSKWSGGCVARTGLACETGNDFRLYKGLKLPDTSNSWYDKSTNLTGCKEMCSRNCSCTAFANSDIREGGSGCLLWFGDLIDMKEYPEAGQDIYVRVALQETGLTQGNKKKVVIITSSVVLIGIVAVGLFLYIRCKKRRNKESIWGKGHIDEEESDEMDLPVFDLTTIAKATDDFSSNNLLGKGGFGSVYKGKLADEQKIAVKRLSDKSRQGLKELKNEVILIAKLQHRNLVKLLGCCIEGDENLLIYEYLPNGSLDYFIFDQARSKLLEWLRRKHIIGGIARGLLYLHEDSRLRIIHRDLKASNVLLDEDMNPKISDFGLARIFGGDQTEANTNKVVGTHGYMSPEYAVDGLFSIRSDIFSFGVLVLEIVSGKKNRGFHHPGHDHNLLGHAWKLWTENRPLDLTDSMLGDSCVPSEVLRCIHLGLLCVQQKPDDRPNMSFVVSMLGNESSLPQPKKPGFFIERNQPEAESSSSVHDAASINETTITVLEPR